MGLHRRFDELFSFLDRANRADIRLISALELIIPRRADTSLMSARSIVCVPPAVIAHSVFGGWPSSNISQKWFSSTVASILIN